MMDVVPPDDWSPALVVVDVQNKFYHATKGLKESFDRCSDRLNRTIGMFREVGRPIIFVCYEGPVEGLASDCPDMDAIVDSVDFRPGDKVVWKSSMDCFHDSGLSRELGDSGCDSIVLSGMVAHLCVLSTYFSAYNMGFHPYMAKGTLAATNQENVVHTEAIAATLDEGILRGGLSRFVHDGQFDYKCRLRWGWHECVRCLQIGHRDGYVQRSPLQGRGAGDPG